MDCQYINKAQLPTSCNDQKRFPKNRARICTQETQQAFQYYSIDVVK